MDREEWCFVSGYGTPAALSWTRTVMGAEVRTNENEDSEIDYDSE